MLGTNEVFSRVKIDALNKAEATFQVLLARTFSGDVFAVAPAEAAAVA